MNWSSQQESAIKQVERWLRSEDQVYYLAGFAGTGKSTIAKHLVDPRYFLFATFTGKAALVMRQKGCSGAQTLHSLIYRPNGESKTKELETLEQRAKQVRELAIAATGEERDKWQTKLLKLLRQITELNKNNRPRFDLWAASPLADPMVRGLVVDEVSMVGQRLGEDLLSFGKKLLVLGDPFQLPPVGDGGYFTNRKPDVMLTEVHRHARDSGILRLATKVREGGQIDLYDSTVGDVLVMPIDGRRQDRVEHEAMSSDQVLCGRNATRHRLNQRMRKIRGFDGEGPQPGERLVCLRNSRDPQMLNGQQYECLSADWNGGDVVDLEVRDLDDTSDRFHVSCWTHHFVGKGDELKAMGPRKRDYMEMDYAHAMTVHKSQGSQWRKVCVIDEGASFGEHAARWRYTAITRASEKLVVVL